MPVNVLDQVRPWFSFLFEGYGCRVSEEENSESFGDSLAVVTCDDLRIRFVRDRGDISVDIAAPVEDAEWYDLAIVRLLICGGELLESPGPEELGKFLSQNYSRVRDLFGAERLRTTVGQLRNYVSSRDA